MAVKKLKQLFHTYNSEWQPWKRLTLKSGQSSTSQRMTVTERKRTDCFHDKKNSLFLNVSDCRTFTHLPLVHTSRPITSAYLPQLTSNVGSGCLFWVVFGPHALQVAASVKFLVNQQFVKIFTPASLTPSSLQRIVSIEWLKETERNKTGNKIVPTDLCCRLVTGLDYFLRAICEQPHHTGEDVK